MGQKEKDKWDQWQAERETRERLEEDEEWAELVTKAKVMVFIGWLGINGALMIWWIMGGLIKPEVCDSGWSLATFVFPGSAIGCWIAEFLYWFTQPIF